MKTLIFLHIVKTAGTTLRSVLLPKFPGEANCYLNTALNPQCIEEFKQLSERRKSRLGYVHAHMVPFGIHRYLTQATYITILRNPADRVISEYYYICRDSGHPAHSVVKELRFEDYINSGVLALQTENNQTRIISGVGGTYQILGRENLVSRSDLQRAKANIGKYYLVAGLFERFDETLVLLKRILGWRMRDIFYRRLNVGNNRSSVKNVAGHIINEIERYNELDFELYEYVHQQFASRIYCEGPSFARELLLFRFCNKIYGRIKDGKERIRNLVYRLAKLRQIDFSQNADH